MSAALPTPLDVRLMNATASALFVALAALGLAAVLWWGLRHPMFSIVAIQVQGDLTHNNAVTLRANVAHRLSGNLFTLDLAAARSTLVVLIDRLATLLPEGGEALRSLCASEPRPRRLCDVLSAALVRPPRTRRQLLELRDISKRVDLLSAELARLIRELQGGTASGPN